MYSYRDGKHNDQLQNHLLLDIFKINAANTNCTLLTAKLEVGSGIFYPETGYSSTQISRILRDACNFKPNASNDYDTGNMLTLTNFGSLYGLIYFDLHYVNEAVSMDNTVLTLHYRLNIPATADYRIYALVLNEEDVILETKLSLSKFLKNE